MARKATHDWSALLTEFFRRQEVDSSYKRKQFAKDEGLSEGSLSRALTKYKKGEIELSSVSPNDRKNDRNYDRKNDHNYDRSSGVSEGESSANSKSKHVVTSSQRPSGGGSVTRSSGAVNSVGAKRKRGGQKGNRNAIKHGLYAASMSYEMQVMYEEALSQDGGVEHELAIARVKLAEALRKKNEQEELERLIEMEKLEAANSGEDNKVQYDSDGNQIPSDALPARFNHAAMQPEAFEDNIGPLGMTIKMKRVDWDSVIDRWLGRISNLESLRQKLLQGHSLSYSERLAIQSTTFNQLASGKIDAITAGNLLSANAIDIPSNLLAQIRVELGEEGDDSELAKGGVTPQMVEEREKALQAGCKQSAEEFMKERMAALEDLNAQEANT